jgi:guanylate cyclase
LQKCADHKVSDKKLYPTFARTFPPNNQVTKSILSLLLHFEWSKITLVVSDQSPWPSTAEKLADLAKDYNVTINGKFTYDGPHTPGKFNPFPKIVEDSYIDTRSKYDPEGTPPPLPCIWFAWLGLVALSHPQAPQSPQMHGRSRELGAV